MRRCACGDPLEFDSARCRRCGRAAGFCPRTGAVASLSPDAAARRCINSSRAKCGCNWLAARPGEACFACSLTRVIPPQDNPTGRAAWRNFERAKRRLVAGLLRLKLLPRFVRDAAGNRLEINLLADRLNDPTVQQEFVLTGHSQGVITINTRETDRATVETTRVEFGEKYRTLLGNLRHESGHFFWGALIAADDNRLSAFRALFGDERADYQAALARHYETAKRRRRFSDPCFISAYARAHPHEDWAETWSHFLHIGDALSTAAAAGMIFHDDASRFDAALSRFREVAAVVNSLNHALGHSEAYPFFHPPKVVEKLRFVSETVAAAADDEGRAQI